MQKQLIKEIIDKIVSLEEEMNEVRGRSDSLLKLDLDRWKEQMYELIKQEDE